MNDIPENAEISFHVGQVDSDWIVFIDWVNAEGQRRLQPIGNFMSAKSTAEEFVTFVAPCIAVDVIREMMWDFDVNEFLFERFGVDKSIVKKG